MFFYNVFNQVELSLIENDLKSKLEEDNWTTHKNFSGKILDNRYRYPLSSGTIRIKSVNDEIKKIIRKLVNNIDKNCRFYNFEAYYQVFDKTGSFGLHTDEDIPFVATFYLNKNWSVNDGGLYVYMDNEEYKLYVPQYNSLNFITKENYSMHCVTPVTEYAVDKRYTIHVKAKS